MSKKLVRGASWLLLFMVPLAVGGCGGGSSSPTTSGGSTPGNGTSDMVSGTVSGLSGDESVTLLNNGGDALVVVADGGFTFPSDLAAGSAYAVTVQSHTPGIACSVANGSGTAGSSEATTVAVYCAAGAVTVLYSFASSSPQTDALSPEAGLIEDSAGNLYGTTSSGGAGEAGTVFKLSAAGTETILHSFAGGSTDGADPQAGLVMDSAGNLYGSTYHGGANNDGTVFRISPTGTETILHSFAGAPTDGAYPTGDMVMDSAENLYGATTQGGANGWGAVFKISATGTETLLHSFAGNTADGLSPQGGLMLDSTGSLYGTTGSGTVFKISRAGAETILYSFTGPTGGANLQAGLIMDSAGNLYGTTSDGGANHQGSVFKISPTGAETDLYSFLGAADGADPQAGLIMDSAGDLYGTTSQGGASSQGSVFEISPTGTKTVLHSFNGNPMDGDEPKAGLIVDSDGNLYGTTLGGGPTGGGTVFEIN